MAKFIESEKALEECDWYANEFCECEYAIMPLKGALENLPAADVRPAVRGKWSTVYDDFMKSHYDTCSCCGKEYFGANGFNFCPNCGADMREANDE